MFKLNNVIYLVFIILLTNCTFIKKQTSVPDKQSLSETVDLENSTSAIQKLNKKEGQSPELATNDGVNMQKDLLTAPSLDTQKYLVETISSEYSVSKSSQSAPKPSQINDLAKQLGGVATVDDKKNLSAIKANNFVNITKSGWENLRQFVINPLQNWHKKHLSQLDNVTRVFYPFGGPDATYVTQLFPSASEYILVGLEAIGSKESAASLISDEGLDFMNKSMEHFFKKGYFVTSYMTTLSAKKKGITPLVLAQLSNLGYQIIDIQHGSISSEGDFLENLNGLIPLICITFKSKDTVQEKRIIYLKCKLNNTNEDILHALFKYISSKEFMTFIKSASYTLHDQIQFSIIRSFIMDESVAILQDDTGIPFNLLIKTFDTQLFGFYDKPTLAVFNAYKQPALANAYKKTKTYELPFRVGDGRLFLSSNLLLATRK
jgi:hypothetical protein